MHKYGTWTSLPVESTPLRWLDACMGDRTWHSCTHVAHDMCVRRVTVVYSCVWMGLSPKDLVGMEGWTAASPGAFIINVSCMNLGVWRGGGWGLRRTAPDLKDSG